MILLAWLLVILNCLDGIATYVGISLFIISEANPLLALLDPYYVLMIKLYLSTLLALFILQHPIHQLGRGFKYLFGCANICYVGVLVLHIYWISLSTIL